MEAGIYTNCLLKRRVKLPAALQNRHAAESIAELLRARVEGVCGADGYIRPRSVEVTDVSPGIIEMSSLSGHAVYNVTFTADVCNPAKGDVLTLRVENVTPYGVLAVNMSDHRVLEVILQREPVSFEHAESVEDLEPGDTVTLEVMCRHFKLGQKHITLVGRAVSKDHAPRRAELEDSDADVDDADAVSDADTDAFVAEASDAEDADRAAEEDVYDAVDDDDEDDAVDDEDDVDVDAGIDDAEDDAQ
jgi:DNA-directed RNA polymerase subunit E'/Rpb7